MTFEQQLLLQTLPSILIGIATFIIGRMSKMADKKDDKIEQDKEMQKYMKRGIVELLRLDLIEYHDKYIERGEIPKYAYENYEEMYETYHFLGGNGMVTQLHKDVEELKIK